MPRVRVGCESGTVERRSLTPEEKARRAAEVDRALQEKRWAEIQKGKQRESLAWLMEEAGTNEAIHHILVLLGHWVVLEEDTTTTTTTTITTTTTTTPSPVP